jgi:hypothetical protein
MKNSELVKLAQIAVVSSPTLAPTVKLEVINYLMGKEELEIFREEQERKAEEEKQND